MTVASCAFLPYGAKALIPLRAGVDPTGLDLRAAAEPGVTVVTSPSALLRTEELTTVLTDAGRRPLWLRLGREDEDPAMLLTSLIVAARRHDRGAGRATLDLMCARPGPVYGWADLFDRIADELIGLERNTGALVLEHAHRLPADGAGLVLLTRRVLGKLTRAGMPCTLLTYQELASPALSPITVRRLGEELRPPAPVVVAALRAARDVLGPEVDRDWPVETTIDDLLVRVARGLLATLDAAERHRLGLALELEYAERPGAPAAGPWWQRLDDGWARIRTAWRAPLRRSLSRRDLPGRSELVRAAAALAADGHLERAVPLYLDLGDEESAARILAADAERLMDSGMWDTLGRWIRRLPDGVLAGRPELIHYRGEIDAARGEITPARRWFSLAASRFTARADHRGACRALLAASTLAENTGDLRSAAAQAAAAGALAEATGDPADRMWAAWQQASVALAGNPNAALVSFARAATDRTATDPVRLTGRLSRQLLRLRRRHEQYRAAQAALEERERETLSRLVTSVTVPAPVEARPPGGWSATPVPVRLRYLVRSGAAAPSAGQATEPAGHLVAGPPALVHAGAECVSPPAGPVLVTQLLGPLQVALGDTPVQEQMGSRVRSLFAYLVTHRHPWPSRDVLAEALWPEAPTDSARNRLHVAVHGLRRAFLAATDEPLVIRSGSGYRLAAALRYWLDTEDFENRLRRAKEHEGAGAREAATADFEYAVGLYRGDFLADLPYEDWPALTREQLRLAYLDALDRLAALHFGADRYARSAEVCRRLLDLDPCREDAHRRLMRCYSRQGQPHLALLQFRTCAGALARDLKVQPGPETIGLYRRIGRHEHVRRPDS